MRVLKNTQPRGKQIIKPALRAFAGILVAGLTFGMGCGEKKDTTSGGTTGQVDRLTASRIKEAVNHFSRNPRKEAILKLIEIYKANSSGKGLRGRGIQNEVEKAVKGKLMFLWVAQDWETMGIVAENFKGMGVTDLRTAVKYKKDIGDAIDSLGKVVANSKRKVDERGRALDVIYRYHEEQRKGIADAMPSLAIALGNVRHTKLRNGIEQTMEKQIDFAARNRGELTTSDIGGTLATLAGIVSNKKIPKENRNDAIEIIDKIASKVSMSTVLDNTITSLLQVINDGGDDKYVRLGTMNAITTMMGERSIIMMFRLKEIKRKASEGKTELSGLLAKKAEEIINKRKEEDRRWKRSEERMKAEQTKN